MKSGSNVKEKCRTEGYGYSHVTDDVYRTKYKYKKLEEKIVSKMHFPVT
jgi:hypothetical protein